MPGQVLPLMMLRGGFNFVASLAEEASKWRSQASFVVERYKGLGHFHDLHGIGASGRNFGGRDDSYFHEDDSRFISSERTFQYEMRELST